MKNKSKTPEKHYTYNLLVSFNMQFTFTEKDVQPDEFGFENDFEPTDKALADLEKELEDYLSQGYGVDKMEVWGDSDDLLGVDESDD